MKLSNSQMARRERNACRRRGLARDRAINAAQNVKDKIAADLRRRARLNANNDTAIAHAFTQVEAAKATQEAA